MGWRVGSRTSAAEEPSLLLHPQSRSWLLIMTGRLETRGGCQEALQLPARTAALWVSGSPGDTGGRLSLAMETGTSGGREMVAGRSDVPKARQDIGSGPDTGTQWESAPRPQRRGLGEGMCFS